MSGSVYDHHHFTCVILDFVPGVNRTELQRSFEDFGVGPLLLDPCFLATFGVKDRPINMSLCS